MIFLYELQCFLEISAKKNCFENLTLMIEDIFFLADFSKHKKKQKKTFNQKKNFILQKQLCLEHFVLLADQQA